MRVDDQIALNYRNARKAFLAGRVTESEAHYRLNRMLGFDLYYEVDLPQNLMFVHPIGTVLGRATYGDYLCVYQNVGVGSDLDGNRPKVGEGVVLFPGAKVLGNTVIGNNVFVTANTVVQNCEIPDNSIVFPSASDWDAGCGWKHTDRSVIRDVFKVKIQ